MSGCGFASERAETAGDRRRRAGHFPNRAPGGDDVPMQRNAAVGILTVLALGSAVCFAVSRPGDSPAAGVQDPPPTPLWIWAAGEKTADSVVLSRTFVLDAEATLGRVVASVDNVGRVTLDGRELGASKEWDAPIESDVGVLGVGTHELKIFARNEGGPAGAIAMIEFVAKQGVRTRIVTDGSWQATIVSGSTDADRAGGGGAGVAVGVKVLGKLGDPPWGDAPAAAFHGTPQGDMDRAITTPEGFVCELVYVAPKARGSIVALAADMKHGRLIAGAQYGRLFALTPSADGAPAADTRVEVIEPEISGAHGLLAVDDDLFVVVNEKDPEGRGLWRLRDADGDGKYDDKKMLGHVAGDGGEHGPHQVVLAPDGSLWVVGGNHCSPPEASLVNSRLPKVWQEDIIFSRIWDPNGHAVGLKAPGGWVVRTDRDGAKWELMTAGFRNSYDLAFDELGRAFTFDSDMEWDMGLPWYRPTRVCELASGVDYGWRSGSGKWPAWSPDSAPPAVEVGPASPTGLLSSAGLRFPPPYHDGMFFLDWTFGTIWFGRQTEESAEASSPRFSMQIFLTGKPLPVTDAVVFGGAMYFAVGGRNLPSAVYRVRAKEPIAIKRVPRSAPAALVARRELEQHHVRRDATTAEAVVAQAFVALDSTDIGVRSAARIALEHQDVALWRERATGPLTPAASILALVALARAGDPGSDGPAIARRLTALESVVRGTPLEKEWLRGCELWHLRGMTTPPAESEALQAALLANFPCPAGLADSGDLDIYRAALLAKLGAPEAVSIAVALLERPATVVAATVIDPALLARGGSYGKAIRDMQANAPATQKIGFVHGVRDARAGWTPELRTRFARSIAQLRRATGGNSFQGFLSRMADEFNALAPLSERAELAALAKGETNVEPSVSARGPGRVWTEEAIVALAPKLNAGRDHREGRRAYRAAQCAQCHHGGGNGLAGGLGGAGGPELTGIANRFSLADLATAILDPGKTISDQYQNTDYKMKNGRTTTGRIVSDENGILEVRTVLLSDVREKIRKANVVRATPSPVSPMPSGLLDALSEGEVLDLLAFLRSGGDESDPAFAPADKEGRIEIFSSARPSKAGLAAFTFDSKFWSIENGEIVGRTTKESPAPHNTFLIWNGEVRDFELDVELKVVGNNSGVQYRSTRFEAARLRGPQIDAHPAPAYVAMLYEEGGRGILAEHGTSTTIAADGSRTNAPLPSGGVKADIAEWHTYRVVAKGAAVSHFLDGKQTVEFVDRSKDAAKGGALGVQIHGGEPTEVRIKSIRLRRLDG